MNKVEVRVVWAFRHSYATVGHSQRKTAWSPRRTSLYAHPEDVTASNDRWISYLGCKSVLQCETSGVSDVLWGVFVDELSREHMHVRGLLWEGSGYAI